MLQERMGGIGTWCRRSGKQRSAWTGGGVGVRQEDGVIPPIALEPEGSEPLYAQLYEGLRNAIAWCSKTQPK